MLDYLFQTEPFSPVEKDGKIFARGAADDKGGLMAMLIACLVLQEMQPQSQPLSSLNTL